ncbi:MAG TPA: hypothetical protein DIW85_03750 [Stenotrophomonas sp.]|jgi:hypothetical protein|nr:hypothetical protein [Stenotrophomonas sp.]
MSAQTTACKQVKRYRIEQEWGDAWVILEIDHAQLTPEVATQINAFWTGADARLAGADDNPVVAVIKMAAADFIGMVLDARGDLTSRGMQEEFDDQEGWPAAHGVKLVDWDGRPDLDSALLQLTELES